MTPERSRGFADAPRGADVTLATLLAPIVERWRAIVLTMVVFGAIGAALAVVRSIRYEAELTLATVSSSPALQLGGAAALLAGSGLSQSGFQANPALVASLLESRRVLYAVGVDTVGPGKARIVDRARDERVASDEVAREMARLVRVSVSRETGLVTVTVTHPDSALARRIAAGVVGETTRTFVQTARAQATQMRVGQETRVDSAGRRLRRAQLALQAFRTSNRGFGEYAASTLTEASLARELSLAENVYARAVGDREGAIAKELEETPVVVVVDSLPEALPAARRYIGLITLLSVFAGFMGALVWIFAAEALHRQTAAGSPDSERLREAVSRVPGLRRGRRTRVPVEV